MCCCLRVCCFALCTDSALSHFMILLAFFCFTQCYIVLCPCVAFLRSELRVFDNVVSCLMMRVVVCEFVALIYASTPH